MSTRTTTLALEVVSEVADGVAGLADVESAAQDATSALDKLSAANEDVGRKLDGVTTAADGLDAAGAQLTGALGALGSGFELIGADAAAEALQKAGLATDFLSGVGQTAALAVQAQAGATKALEVAQKAANIAMRANPIGLVVTAALLLVGALVLAYNKSETFREIVQDVGRKGKAALDAVVTAVQAVVSWVGDRIPGAFELVKKGVALYLTPPKLAFDLIRDAVQAVWEWVQKVPGKLGELKDKADEIAGPLLAPFTAVKDAIDWILDKIANFHPPSWLPGFGRTTASDPTFGNSSGGSSFTVDDFTRTSSPRVQITVQGALDPYSTAKQISDLLDRYDVAVS